MNNTYKLNLPTQNYSNYTIGTSTGYNGTFTTSSNYNIGDGVMKIYGDPASLEVKGKVIVNGQDLEERLKTIERVLMIPERDPAMEAKYPSLKKKYDEYINSLSKYRMWENIKGQENNV
jgi:hypothetical protein